MSDNIDIPINATGADGVNRLVAAFDQLDKGLNKVSSNTTALNRLTKEMKEMSSGMAAGVDAIRSQIATMQQVMVTGFAEMANAAKAGATRAGQATTTAIEAEGAKSVAAIKANALKMKEADAATWGQIQRGSATNVSKAFNQLAQGVPVERVEKRLGELAAKTAQSMAGQIEKLRQFQANTKSMWETHYKGLAGASEAEIARAHAMNKKWDDQMRAKSASKVDPKTLLGLPSDSEMSRFTNSLRARMTAEVAAEKAAATLQRTQERSNTVTRQATPIIQQSTRAITDHNNAMRDAHGLARGLAGSLGGLWLTYGSLVPLLAGAAIAGSLKQVVTVGKEVENQLNFVSALTKEDINLDKFLSVTDSSLRSVVESSNAMRMLAQNGLNLQESLSALPAILDLATVGEMKVGQAALAATGATSAFGLQISEVSRVADIFAVTAANSNTSVLAITESMKQASTVSSLFKVTIEETAGMLGLLAKINITGGAAGTSMTNMLTGLYEPTEKGKRALKELGVQTMTASGQLKPFTQLLDELKGSLSRFNDSARVDLLGSIFTIRGVKSAELALQNIDTFKEKVDEAKNASGFMRDVVLKLEDSTTGAFDRMGVALQNTMVKSFKDASPYVQRIGIDLAHAFGSKGAETSLGNLSTNVARVTSGLIENAGAVGAAAAGYLLWRVAAMSLVPAVLAASGATTAATTASVVATAASAAFNTAQVAGVATTALYTTALEAQAAATAAAAAASRAWMAVVMPALGALAVALAAGAALWLLFRDNTDEADRSNMRVRNSIDVVNEGLDREIERLEKANDLWDKKNGRFKSEGGPGASTLEKARQTQTEIEDRIVASGGTVQGAMRPQYVTTPTGIRAKTADYTELSSALIEARQNVARLEVAEGEFNSVLKPKRNAESARRLVDQEKENAEKFAKQVSQVNSKGELFQQNEQIRDIYRKGGSVVADLAKMDRMLESGSLNDAEYKDVQARVDQSRTDLQILRDQASELQADRALKAGRGGAGGDTAAAAAAKAAREAGNEEVKRLQGVLELQKQSSAFNISQAQAQNKRGELGDLELINIELREKLALDQSALTVARAQAAVPDISGARKQGFENREDQAKQQEINDVAAAASKRRDVLASMAEDERQYAAETSRDKGQFVDAYLSDYAAKYLQVEQNLQRDIATVEDEGDWARLMNYQTFLAKMKAAGTAAALGQEIGASFDLALTDLDVRLQDIALRNGPGTGLAGIFTNAMDAAQAYSDALPALMAEQQKAQALADGKDGTPALKEQANKLMLKLRNEAQAQRGIWLSLADTIGDSLTRAFGRAGTALGGLLKATTVYGVKRRQIDEDYARAAKDTPERLARAQIQQYNATTSAQISSYADMTSAAQGFFTEGSKGYIALGAAEKAFRVIEIGMAIQTAAVKSGLWTMLTGLFVTGEATKASAAVAGAGVIVGANTAAGVSAAAAGVAAQAVGEPYSAWARMAAMATAMAALGFVVGGSGRGGGGGKTAAEVQKEQGTGSVFGDSSAKSASIANSIERMEKYSGDLIPINQSMLGALRSIEQSMNGLANLVVREPGVMNGTNMGIQEGTIKRSNGTGGSILGGAVGYGLGSSISLVGAVFGPIGAAIGAVLGNALGKLWGKTKQNVVDSGIQFGGSVRSLQAGQGYNQYASVDTTKSSWFGLSKKTSNRVETEGLSGELSSQMGLIFTDLETALNSAAVGMGMSATQVKTALDSLTIDMTNLSLKDLKGDELTQALNAVISKTMDQMSAAAFPALDAFRQVGEGYTETVMRLASNYGVLDAALASMGTTFGMTGMSSLAARERLIALAGGIDKLSEQSSSFSDNYLTQAEKLAPVQKYVTEQLAALGYAGLKTREDFKGAVLGLANSGALATESGAKTYTGLMALQEAFAAVTPEIRDLSRTMQEIADEAKDLQDELDELMMTRVELLAKERAQLDPSNRALFDQIQAAKSVIEAKDNLVTAYEAERDAMQATIDRLAEMGKSLQRFRDGLMLGDKSTLTPEEKYAEARRQYTNTVTAARGGDVSAQDRFEEVANNFLEASRTSYSSSSTYTNDFNNVVSATDEAIKWAAEQGNIEQKKLDALNTQVSQLVEIKTAVMSVAEALRALAAANMAYDQFLRPTPNVGTINDGAQSAATAPPQGGPTQAQMDALIAEVAKARADAAAAAQASIDAAYGSTSAAQAAADAAAADRHQRARWDEQNKMDTNIP